MKRNITLSGFTLCLGLAVSCLLSGCSFFSDPIVGIWKVDPVSVFGGTVAYPSAWYAFQFKSDHIVIAKYVEGLPGTAGEDNQFMWGWERVDDSTIKIDLGADKEVIGATINGSRLQFKGHLDGTFAGVTCVRVDAMPSPPIVPKT